MKRTIGWLMIFTLLLIVIVNAQGLQSRAVNQVLQLIKNYFYNAQNVNIQSLKGDTIQQIVKSLKSRFTYYIPPNRTVAMNIVNNSEYKGVGMQTTWNATTQKIDVLSIMIGSPAWKSGLRAGDEIVEVNGTPVERLGKNSQNDIDKNLQKSAVLVVYRPSTRSTMTLKVKHVALKLKTVKYDLLKIKKFKIAYVQITNFTEDTYENFTLIISKVMKWHPDGLIIDLRDNPGGVVMSANDIFSMFVSGEKIFSVIRFGDKLVKPIYTNGINSIIKLPIVLLVNKDTASSAEMFSAAMRFYLKTPLVGTKTFGKSAIQGVFHLVNGGFLLLVEAHAINPEGKDIAGVGVKPDYVVKNSKRWNRQFKFRIWRDMLKTKVKLDLSGDHQLQKAISVLIKEIVKFSSQA